MHEDYTVQQMRRLARNTLGERSNSAQIDADCIISHVLNLPRSALFARPEQTISETQTSAILDLIKRRSKGEPLAYLTESQEFWSLPLKVNSAVLIPRPATETLVEKTLAIIPPEASYNVLELGTGSGAIAIALATERPSLNIVATDISPQALSVARDNAQTHHIESIEFIHSDWFTNVPPILFDVVVSNPPYIAHDDIHLETNVRLYEPLGALISEANGIKDIRTIAEQASRYLKDAGYLVIEHGWQQQQEVDDVLSALSYQSIECFRDLDGLPRVTSARRKKR